MFAQFRLVSEPNCQQLSMLYLHRRLAPRNGQPPFLFTVTSSSSVSIFVSAVGLMGVAFFVALAPFPYLLLGGGGVVAFLALVRHPWLIWPALGVLLPFSSADKVRPISLTDLLLAGAVALWFADGVRRRTLRLLPSPPVIVLLLFIGAFYLSLLQAHDLGEAGVEVLKWVEFGLVLLLAPPMVGGQRAPWLIAALLLGGMAQALLGLYQFVFRIGPEWFIIMGRFMRASGTFSQPNPFGGYLGLSLPIAASLALWAGGGEWKKWSPSATAYLLWASFYSGATLLLGAGLLASWSRGGWLGALGGLWAVLLLRNRRTAVIGGGVSLLVGLALLSGAVDPGWIPAPLAARIQDIPAYLGFRDVLQQPVTDENFAIIERVAHWVAAWRMWERAPWLGVGPGNYAVIYPMVRLPRWEDPLGHAHNIYLNLLAEGGIVGLAIYLLFWITVVGWLWRQRSPRQFTQPWTNAFTVGVIGMVLYLSIHNFFDNLFVQGIYLQVALWLAAVQSASTPAKQ